jgi:hypothetical protein
MTKAADCAELDSLETDVDEQTLATPASGEIEPEPGPAALTFEERFDKVSSAVLKQPLHREILYRTLLFCKQQRDLPDVEAEIATYPEFAHAAQNQYRLITFLVDAGGLDRLELDEDGAAVTPERTEGLTENEIDDLVVSYALITTDAGAAVADALDPKRRIFEIFGLDPAYEDTYVELLEFCEEPRKIADIDALLKDRSVLAFGRTASTQAIKPSFFVDQLERGGGIVWKNGWVISDEGREILAVMRKEM